MTLGGLLQRQTSSRPSPKTIRQWVRDYSDPVPWMQAGTMLGLGQNTDRPISQWQSFFLPEVLMQHLNEITVTIDDVRQPLVSKFITLSEGDIEPAGSELFLVIFWYALAGTLLAAVMTLFSRTESGTRWVLMIVQTIVGLLGTGLLALWLLTEHSDAYRNENLFLFSPLSLWLVWQLLRRHFSPALTRAAIVLLLLPAITGLLLKLTPWFYQDNPEILLFILPVHLVTIMLIWKKSRGGRQSLLQNVANTLSLEGVLRKLDGSGVEHLDHWKQGEFHHDFIIRLTNRPAGIPADVLIVGTNCNGGVKDIICLDQVPERWALWNHRCPDNPEFEGKIGAIRAHVRTRHYFDPCDLLKPDTRSEYRPEFRRRQRGGGWVPIDSTEE